LIFFRKTVNLEKLKDKIDKILIAAVIPSFLEKGGGLFSKSFEEIEKSRHKNPYIARNTLIAETGQKIKLSEFLRNIAELGYTKVWEAERKGEFSQRGGIIHVFPINSETPCSIEFAGNYIMEITPSIPLTLRGRANSDAPLKIRGARGVMKSSVGYEIEFRLGDYVVHLDHGIGIFRGENENDFIIEYAPPKDRASSPDILYIPKHLIKKLSPYLGFKKPAIHRLGTPTWSFTKKKAKEDIIAFAKELLKTLAERRGLERPPYESFYELEEELIADFPHEYTPDQKRVLREIFEDMAKPDPMDRILTGDVGFGKTEVAVLAAFRAVLNKKQVAVLAPTTILADQHADVFKRRLCAFGVEVERLTRLEIPESLKKIFKKAGEGKIDIIIGTHKILTKDLKFKDLGLLIVDEEQKFGVLHKEKLKKELPSLDILTLSATPIPRTLNLALSGLRKISSIETAPESRLEIKTYTLPKNQKIIKEAIRFELQRNGQIYFLANRIHKIPALLDELKSLKIKMRIGILHGRMNEEMIVRTMHNFRERKIDLLVSTTIIENGLDLSNVNTIIVEDSTKLGLAQAHQLRGRIGRGEKEAFAYFLYPAQKLKEKAAERLEALERYSWLGAGLELAKKDLEIRGAGNILGRAQSGIAFRIGLNLYFELLKEAVGELKK